MTNLIASSNMITICKRCGNRIPFKFQLVDLFIYFDIDNTSKFLTLKKTFTNKPDNELYLRELLVNSLKKKPFIARVTITQPRYLVIEELVKIGFLTNSDVEQFRRFYDY